jgi:lipopolysaccharide export LptBFGC system permease protein LptF
MNHREQKPKMPCLKLSLFVSFLVFLFVSNLHAQASVISLGEIPEQNPQDVNEKRTRTPAQQKIDSRLLQAAQLKRQGLVTTEADVVHDSMGRAVWILAAT